MKRILALLLTLMMALSLTACGGDNNADLVGTWKWTCDITEEFQKGVNEGAGMDVPVEAKVEMKWDADREPDKAAKAMVFNEDGTFTLSVDKDALSASVQGYIDAMVPVTVDLVYQQLEGQGMSRADIDEAMKAQGITVEEYVKQLFGALDVDQLTDGLDQENLTGYFRAAKGKLYTSEKENSFSQDDYAEYTLENGVMKWTGGSSALISDFGDVGVELPIEWVKQ